MNPTPMTELKIDMDVYKAIEAARESFDESQNDILRKMLLSGVGAVPSPVNAQQAGATIVRAERTTGDYGFLLKGQSFSFTSLKSAYRNCLLEFAAQDPAFLSNLSKEETSARRIVATDPKELYKKTPHLADEFAEVLTEGWWYDTNLSQQQVESRLQTACKVADLKFGVDLTLIFP